jgi:hypothetical protein
MSARKSSGHVHVTTAVVIALSAVATATALIILSPSAIRLLADTRSDWSLLSDVGQTYQGIAAVLAGMAFCGVALSLLLQWRQNHLTQIIASKERHQELLRFTLENPRYLHLTLGDQPTDIDHGAWIYSHMFVSHWKLAWDLGQLSDASVREHAYTLFLSPEPRAWWTAVSFKWASDDSRRSRRFVSMIDSGHRNAVAATADAVAAPADVAVPASDAGE